MLTGLKSWIAGSVLTLIALVGLFVAAGGGTKDYYYFGLALAAVGIGGLAGFVRHLTHKA